MGNEYLEVGKGEGKKYQVVYVNDRDDGWDKGFDDIEEAVKIAEGIVVVEVEGVSEVVDVGTQQDLFVHDFVSGNVRETDMRTEVIAKGHTKFTYVRKGEPFKNGRVKGHVGDEIEILANKKRGNLKKGIKGKIVAITNSKKKGNLQDYSDWFYKVEIRGEGHWIKPDKGWEVK